MLKRSRFALLIFSLFLLLPTFSGALQAQASTSTLISYSDKATVHAGSSVQTMMSDGLTRSYILYVPSGYNPAQATPLVMSLHGFISNGLEQEGYSRWNQVAESQNFIVAYPNGTGSPQRWNAGQTDLAGQRSPFRGVLAQFFGGYFQTDPVDDVAFIHDLIAHLSDQLCIDPARIYVNGISNGGGMSNRLACQLSDQIAAAAMVEGAYTNLPGGCTPTRAVPILAFHGKDDPIVPYNGAPLIGFPPIETWVSDWATRDRCSLTPQTIAGTVGAVSGIRYTGCADNAEVDFYTIADGGHTWPGSVAVFPRILGHTNEDIDATATMWTFFKAHPMQ